MKGSAVVPRAQTGVHTARGGHLPFSKPCTRLQCPRLIQPRAASPRARARRGGAGVEPGPPGARAMNSARELRAHPVLLAVLRKPSEGIPSWKPLSASKHRAPLLLTPLKDRDPATVAEQSCRDPTASKGRSQAADPEVFLGASPLTRRAALAWR